MNIRQRDVGLLMLVLGCLIFFVSCYFGFRNFYGETQHLRTQNEVLNEQLAALEKITVEKEWYNIQAEDLQRGMEEKIRGFSSDIISEEIVLYMEELEKKAEVHISSVTLPGRTDISIEPKSELLEVLEESSEAVESNSEVADENRSDKENMSFSCIESNIAFTATYSGLKDMIKIITTDKNRKSVDNVSWVLDEKTGDVSGTMTVNFFILEESSEQ